MSYLGNWFVYLLKCVIKTAKICILLTNHLKVLKSVVKNAEIWQFVYVATKLPSCGSLNPRKKGVDKIALLIALFKTA